MRRLRRGRWAIRARGALSCLIGRPVVMHCKFIGGVEFAPGPKAVTLSECMFSEEFPGTEDR